MGEAALDHNVTLFVPSLVALELASRIQVVRTAGLEPAREVTPEGF